MRILYDETAILFSAYYERMILIHIFSLSVPSFASFRSDEHFKPNLPPGRGVMISSVTPDFKRVFGGWFEGFVPLSSFHVYRNSKRAQNYEILQELGGKHESALAHVWYFMTLQPEGRPGVLSTKNVNIFYVKPPARMLQAVTLSWHENGWRVHSEDVIGPFYWKPNQQIFSR